MSLENKVNRINLRQLMDRLESDLELMKLELVNRYASYLADLELPEYYFEVMLSEFNELLDNLDDDIVEFIYEFGTFSIKKVYDDFYLGGNID